MRLTEVAFSADGALALTASVDCSVRAWVVATGNCLRALTGHSKLVSSLVRQLRYLFTAYVRLYILATGSAEALIDHRAGRFRVLGQCRTRHRLGRRFREALAAAFFPERHPFWRQGSRRWQLRGLSDSCGLRCCDERRGGKDAGGRGACCRR